MQSISDLAHRTGQDRTGGTDGTDRRTDRLNANTSSANLCNFLPRLSMKINLHKLHKTNKIKKRDKNKNKKTENGTTTNWPLGKLSLKPGCRYYFNGKQTYFNFNASQGGERFEKKGQQASEMLNQIKVPATQMQNKTKKEQKQKQYHPNWSRGSGKWGSPRP